MSRGNVWSIYKGLARNLLVDSSPIPLSQLSHDHRYVCHLEHQPQRAGTTPSSILQRDPKRYIYSTLTHSHSCLPRRYLDPFASSEAKQAAERSLAALYQPTYGSSTVQEHNNRVLGGYRATLANPNVSDAAKAHARSMLAQAGADPRTQRAVAAQNSQASGQDSHLARQLGGYKSALKSEP